MRYVVCLPESSSASTEKEGGGHWKANRSITAEEENVTGIEQ
jgi:hypothetical protein